MCRHLSKLFDSLARLDFKQEDGDGNGNEECSKDAVSGDGNEKEGVSGGKECKVAVRMGSKDGESVDLDEACECDGQVEQWLNSVELRMQQSVRAKITEAVIAYEEKSREVWIFDWPAQPALTTTQIWWTTEVSSLHKDHTSV